MAILVHAQVIWSDAATVAEAWAEEARNLGHEEAARWLRALATRYGKLAGADIRMVDTDATPDVYTDDPDPTEPDTPVSSDEGSQPR